MVSRAAKYLLPIGGTAFLMPSTVFAASSRTPPACVYDDPPKKDNCGCSHPPSETTSKNTELERFVMMFREELGPLKDKASSYTSTATTVVSDNYKALMGNVCYLRTKAPQEVRLATIAAGGLFGMMLGFRRGLFRKLLNGGLGAAGASYVVYPKETVYYAQNSFSIAKKNAAIGYNFVMGVEPQDKLPSGGNTSRDLKK